MMDSETVDRMTNDHCFVCFCCFGLSSYENETLVVMYIWVLVCLIAIGMFKAAPFPTEINAPVTFLSIAIWEWVNTITCPVLSLHFLNYQLALSHTSMSGISGELNQISDSDANFFLLRCDCFIVFHDQWSLS